MIIIKISSISNFKWKHWVSIL